MNYNKLKRSAEKITMPENMEERIISHCLEAAEKSTSDSEFSHHVSGVEKARPRNITRIISAAAACTVIAGSVGVTVHLLDRSSGGNNKLAGEIEESVTETTSPDDLFCEPGTDENQKIAPFGDFRDHDFQIHCNYYTINKKINSDTPKRLKLLGNEYPIYGVASWQDLTEKQKAELAVFFNNADYPEWTEEDEAKAAASNYSDFKEYCFLSCEDSQFCLVKFDVTGCLTYSYGSYYATDEHPAYSDDYVTEKYRIDYDSFSKAVEQITDIPPRKDVNGVSLISFENCINDGAAVKYTLSGNPRPDLTLEQCRLLDEYFISTCKEEKIVWVEDHEALTEPAIKFEVTGNPELPYSLYIYSDDYIYLKDETESESSWYKFSGDRMYAEIETLFRNGNTTDDAGLYPPFGNLAKISSGAYDVSYHRNGISGTLPIDGEMLHHAFYGYDWAACETDKPETITDKVITFGFDHDGSEHTTINLYDNGAVNWTVTAQTTGDVYEEHWYQLTDTNAFDSLSEPFTASCINQQSDIE